MESSSLHPSQVTIFIKNIVTLLAILKSIQIVRPSFVYTEQTDREKMVQTVFPSFFNLDQKGELEASYNRD
jgi:hypothetical protein